MRIQVDFCNIAQQITEELQHLSGDRDFDLDTGLQADAGLYASVRRISQLVQRRD